MLQLIGTTNDDPELDLAQAGLDAAFPDAQGFLYGCTLFKPGLNYEPFAKYLGAFNLLGILGLTFNEESLCALTGRPEAREAFGRILQLAPPPIYTWSSVSKEWALHYAIAAEIGGHPAWLAPATYAEEAFVAPDREIQEGRTLPEAFAFALCGKPFLLRASEQEKFRTQRVGVWNSYPLTQFVQTYNCHDNLVLSDEEYTERLKSPVLPLSRTTVDRAIELARTTVLDILQRQERVPAVYALKAAFAAAGIDGDTEVDELGVPLSASDTLATHAPSSATLQIPELVVGKPFNPSEHYSQAYFGGGVRYTKTNGAKDTYYGPSQSWDGFDTVANAMVGILLPAQGPLHKRLRVLDIGCGYGDFVYRARKTDQRLDVFGIDLSEAAVQSAPPPVRPYLIVGDTTDPNVQDLLRREPFHVVTAWDFWEHIYEEDNEKLIEAVHDMLQPGGFLFSIICTRGRGEENFIHPKGGLATEQNSWALVSGHVNIRLWYYWVEKFLRHGFLFRGDVGHQMLALFAGDPVMRGPLAASWSPKNLIVMSRK